MTFSNRALDKNGDYTFGSGLSNFLIDSPEAVAQAVQTRLKLWEGEWFLDTTEGTPYVGGILGKYTQGLADTLIKERILATAHVAGIASYSGVYDGNARNYAISATINTDFGDANIYGAF